MKYPVIIAIGAVALTLPLAACGQNNTKKDEAPAPAASAMRDGPRAGLWRLSMTNSLNPSAAPMTQEVCVTREQFDPPSAPSTETGVTCTPSSFAREGDAMVASTTCTKQGGGAMDSTVRVTGDLETSYTMVSTTRMNPAPAGANGDVTMTTQAQRIGDCPA
jgi:Protein of unknown function (DUF3617).